MTTELETLITFLRWRGKGDYTGDCFMPPSPHCTDAADLIEALVAENQELKTGVGLLEKIEASSGKAILALLGELEKAKAELGARNRILTEEP